MLGVRMELEMLKNGCRTDGRKLMFRSEKLHNKSQQLRFNTAQQPPPEESLREGKRAQGVWFRSTSCARPCLASCARVGGHPPALRDREARREARQLWDEPRAQRGLLACSGLALAAAGAAARRARGVNRRRCVVGRRANAAVEDGLPRRAAIGVAGLAFTVLGLKRFAIDGPPEFDPQPSSLQGKTVVITGGNTGLGRESAVRLARAGARVVLTTRSEAKGVQAVEQVTLDAPSGPGVSRKNS
ncbi:Corticosteroid 11-beta-dehydrogenase isozyme 1 (11-beta-hydroxysteroid dehydrogenase 1) (11-DH) (11-beta-HSD1) (11beta-HSD1A) [Durusdinium trenchii]|uniref:Corticosteroid 11-beta-dehydrogenase isozyme 1 (11-beta-hydroxysteroid dehydrogenase 1) (11-DH) (11-beta-HSD1) (11beta-HSD1A) n=1 Tax=Durusdinium trenchii TaxID=1381693 RepID=A0ABP0HL55_9DINO